MVAIEQKLFIFAPKLPNHMWTMLLQTALRVERDGGGYYTETNLDRLIVEPLNGISAAFFLVIVAIFWMRIKDNWRDHQFMALCIPILTIGGVGGTIYHLFRIHRFFLFMDWVPILILCLLASFVFYLRSGGRWQIALAVIAGYFVLTFVLFGYVQELGYPIQPIVNINYATMALLVLIPIYLVLYKTQFYQRQWVIYALLSFLAAILFRMLDSTEWVKSNLEGIGTHFLWHTFGALACYAVFQYVYELDQLEKINRVSEA